VGGPPAVMMPTSATVYTKTTTYGAAAPGPAYGGGGYPPQQAPATGGPWGGLAAPSSSSFASLPPKSFNVTQGWVPPSLLVCVRAVSVCGHATNLYCVPKLAHYGQPSPDEMMILREWFNAVDQDGACTHSPGPPLERLRAVSLTPPGLRLLGSGEIDSEELQRALAASGDNFDKQARTIPLVRPHSGAHTLIAFSHDVLQWS
jgi:hypothetical protein